MVARIIPSENLGYILRYNELKVSHQAAELIDAHGFLQAGDRLAFDEKSERFERLNTLNDRIKVNMLHISLNFHPSENLSKDQLRAITARYMEGIGFKDQPYLVYQHNDVGHPHLHVVTSRITADGKGIPLHNIGLKRSSPTRKKIIKEFGLGRAQKIYRHKHHPQRDSTHLQKVIYNDSRETKQSMLEVLQAVNKYYHFTSIQEYNALLRQYNLFADQGGKDSQMAKHGGLVYRVLNEHGNKVGVPIRASDIFFKPTLTNLQKKFDQSQAVQQQALSGIRQKVNWVLIQEPGSLHDFMTDLQKEGIELVVRQNKQGEVYDLTYVDNQSRTAASSRTLGKDYTIAAILAHFQDAIKPALSPHWQQVKTAPPEWPQDKIPGAEWQQLTTGRSTQWAGMSRSDLRQTNTTKPDLQSSVPSQLPAKAQSLTPPQKIALPLVPGFSTKVPQVLGILMEHDQRLGRSPSDLSQEQQLGHRPRR